jgi:hypothetical protein
MRSDLLLFLLWVVFLLAGQFLKKKKKPQKVRQPAPDRTPGPFVCEEAQAPDRKAPVVQPTVKPVRSGLVEEIRDLKPMVAPQVGEIRERKMEAPVHSALPGTLRQGMLWTLVLGEPRSRRSWAQEQRDRRTHGI